MDVQMASASPVKQVPAELWAKIGRYACIDGGFTGCSLSLVSHFMRDATHPARFTSVALASEESCSAFAELLNRMKPFPSILDLYVSPGGHFMQTSLFSIEPPRPMYLKNICAGIIISAAPTLVTLFLQYPVTLGILEGDGIHFPRLRDLSIPHASRPSSGPALQTYICPAVERLHVTQCFPRGINLWEEIVLLAPSVLCVRLTGINQDVCIGSFLKALLNIPSSESSVATHPNPTQAQGAVHIANVAAHLPDTRAVIVQPLKYVNSGWCGTGSIMNGQMNNELDTIANIVGNGESDVRRLVILEETAGYESYRAREDWLDIVGGGDGPWASAPSRGAKTRASQITSYADTKRSLLATRAANVYLPPL